MSQPPNHDPNAPLDELDGQSGLSARARELLGDRRALAAIGVALVAVVALCAFVVVPALRGSSDSNSSTAIARGVPHGTPAASATSSAAPSVAPPTSGPLTIRDPFSPLYVPAAAASTVPSTPATTAPSTSAPLPTAPVPSVVTVPPAPTTAPTQSKVVLTQVVLDKINWTGKAATSTANVTVNGLPYTAQPGKAFANGFTMTAITSGNATFTYGGQTVTLVVGEFGLFAGAA